VRDLVVSHLGDARQIIPTIPGTIDLAILDADKAQTRGYFDLYGRGCAGRAGRS
jgi:predicted O-methyltransferase YrrM